MTAGSAWRASQAEPPAALRAPSGGSARAESARAAFNAPARRRTELALARGVDLAARAGGGVAPGASAVRATDPGPLRETRPTGKVPGKVMRGGGVVTWRCGGHCVRVFASNCKASPSPFPQRGTDPYVRAMRALDRGHSQPVRGFQPAPTRVMTRMEAVQLLRSGRGERVKAQMVNLSLEEIDRMLMVFEASGAGSGLSAKDRVAILEDAKRRVAEVFSDVQGRVRAEWYRRWMGENLEKLQAEAQGALVEEEPTREPSEASTVEVRGHRGWQWEAQRRAMAWDTASFPVTWPRACSSQPPPCISPRSRTRASKWRTWRSWWPCARPPSSRATTSNTAPRCLAATPTAEGRDCLAVIPELTRHAWP